MTGRAKPRGRWTILPATYLVSLVIVGVTVVPLLFVVIDGFRTNPDINASSVGVPDTLSNYVSVLGSAPFWEFLGNSALVAVVATLLAVALGSMAAFALSRYEFRGREFWYTLIVAGLLFPIGCAALPLYLLLQEFGLTDSWVGVALPEAAFALPMTMVILRPFMRAIPAELEEAAMVEGAGRFRFFWQILLPLSKPALVTVGLLAFVTSWNQYLLPLLVFQTTSHFTLPLGAATYSSQYSTNTAAVMAFTALSLIPALAVFLFGERYLVEGAAGAVKG
jgi:raffinose/stachyose/melibiose transport system permease protein